MPSDIVVPTLGESVAEATVAKWLKKVGDVIAVDDPLVELETDKVTLEVNALAAGTLTEIVADAGAAVKVGQVLGRIAEGAAKAPATAPAAKAAEAAKPVAPAPAPAAVAAAATAQLHARRLRIRVLTHRRLPVRVKMAVSPRVMCWPLLLPLRWLLRPRRRCSSR